LWYDRIWSYQRRLPTMGPYHLWWVAKIPHIDTRIGLTWPFTSAND
jgi:hypothetical protein